VPPIRISRRGRLNDEAFRIFVRNSRFPDILRGDIRAVLAGCQVGVRRVGELFARFGRDVVGDAWSLFERQCRDTIQKTLRARIPVGTYESEDAVDGDGMTGRPYRVRMSLTKQGDRISIDTRASDDQARGPINFIMHESVPKLILGIYLLAGHPTQLLNDGAQDAIDEVLVRPGSILQPAWPAALGNRAHTLARVQSNVLALLALATGGDAPAPNSVYNIYFLRGRDPASGEFFLVSDGVAVGYGARPFADGLDAIYYVAQKNYPAEFMEMVFPLRLRQYAIHRDSGGPGCWRGGAGVVREVELLADTAVVALRQDNILFPPAGIKGGRAGRPGRAIVNPGRPDERVLAPMSDGNVLRRGDVLRLLTSGGGGWGNPLDRLVERVRRAEHGMHQRAADAGLLVRRPDAERPETQRGRGGDVRTGAHDVPDQLAVVLRHQGEPRQPGVRGPQGGDQVRLQLGLERGGVDGPDRVDVGWPFRSDQHDRQPTQPVTEDYAVGGATINWSSRGGSATPAPGPSQHPVPRRSGPPTRACVVLG
jgi:N-methylhydantoinase B